MTLWARLGGSAWGRRLFGFALARAVPYSGALKPRVLEIEPGRARIQLRDRHGIRNHLGSVHAVALANLGELASGLAMTAALSADLRAIVTHLEIDYLKKARGVLVAVGSASPPMSVTEPVDVLATADIEDSTGDRVAQLRVTWRVSPRRREGAS